MSFRKLPLAWLNLTHDKNRLLASSGGIAFAVLLMFMQTGFRGAMFDGQVKVLRDLEADLIIANSLKYNMAVKEPFTRRRLYQALEVEGVAAARALYVDEGLWKNAADRSIRPIRVLGFEPGKPVFSNPELLRYNDLLNRPDTALFDSRSRQVFGNLTSGTTSELSNRVLQIVGTFELGPDLINDGNLIMSDKNFLKFFFDQHSSANELGKVDLGIVTLTQGANIETVRSQLQDRLPKDVVVLAKEEFIQQEMTYWQRNSPIGYVFAFGAVMGFVVGIIICYQILFSDVSNQMPQFATIKAMGYHNRYLKGVVLQEALILAALGFVPGLALSQFLYFVIAALTGLPMTMSMGRIGLLFGLTLFMCVISGTLALRKVLSADPADVF